MQETITSNRNKLKLPQEEGQPAQDEHTHDDAQSSSGFVLPFHFD